MRVSSLLLSLAGSVATVAAEPSKVVAKSSPSVKAGCRALEKPLAESVFLPNTAVYDYEAQNFWSNTEILTPGCVFRPQSSDELAEGVKTLVNADAEFAVRGGGHMGIRVSFPL